MGIYSPIPALYGGVLYPVLSKEGHAHFEIDVSAALRVPGVVGWISSTDIQGTNLWSIAGLPDEEVFPSKEVVHVGQIIGVIAAESVEAGSEGVDLVRVTYSPLPAILSTGAALKEKSWHGGKSRSLIYNDNADKPHTQESGEASERAR